MRPRLKTIRPDGDRRVAFAYEDGLAAELDFAAYLDSRHGPMLEPLREPTFFARAFIDHGVLTWPNGYDICPDVLRVWCEAGRTLPIETTTARLALASAAPMPVS